MGVTTVLPLLALVIVSLEGFWTPQIPWGDLSLAAYRDGVFNEPSPGRPWSTASS